MTPLVDVDCVLFDLDGTLADTAPDLGDAANAVRRELNLPPLPDARYRPVASTGARGLLRVALEMDTDHPDYPVRRDALLAYYRANLTRRSTLFVGMNQLLLSLELRGRRWGVVTNKPAFLTDPLMAQLKLDTRAACIVSGDQVPQAKPAPDSLLLALQQVGVAASRTVYVGDDRRDIEAARAADVRSIAAGWGYVESDAPATWGADHLAATPAELSQLLA